MSRTIRLRRTTATIATATAVALLGFIGWSTVAPTPSEAHLLHEHRADSATFPVGSAGIFVTFTTPMPNADYSVTVQQRDTAGYSPTTVCTYFNVLKKTATGFQVQHKRCDDGVPVALDFLVFLDWIAMAYGA
ncbi:MAG TPA: hypothetical protein VNA20_06785 [Frankiaceae bacterium]|nr:hypothetical protein [Frankiaceae bacterium]